MTKKIILLALVNLFCSLSSLKAQENQRLCDGAYDFKSLNLMLSKVTYEEYTRRNISDPMYLWELANKLDYPCLLIAYAKIYDFLFKNGFDVEITSKADVPQTYSIYFEDEKVMAHIQKLRDENLSQRRDYYVFMDFINLNEKYNNTVVKIYAEKRERNLSEDIDRILNSGEYSHPEKVKELLLFEKYKHLIISEIYKR